MLHLLGTFVLVVGIAGVFVAFYIALEKRKPGGPYKADMKTAGYRLMDWVRGLWEGVFPSEHGPGPAAPAPAAPPPPSPLPVPVVPEIPPLPGVGVPPDHAAAIARISSFEPDTDADLIGMMQSEAAAQAAYGQAWEALADNLVSGLGLDPSSVAGAAEFGAVIADTSADIGMIIRRFLTVYQEVLQFRAEGGVLPHNARDFLTGDL